MSVIGSDGLSLLVGDGLVSEGFTALKGMSVSQFEIIQRSNDSTVVGSDAWVVSVGISDRRLILDVDALATDDASAVRLRSLALTGVAGNFRLEMNASEMLNFSAFVTQYREVIDAGAVKKCATRLESSGAVSIA